MASDFTRLKSCHARRVLSSHHGQTIGGGSREFMFMVIVQVL